MDLDKYGETHDEQRVHLFKLDSTTWTNLKCWIPDPFEMGKSGCDGRFIVNEQDFKKKNIGFVNGIQL